MHRYFFWPALYCIQNTPTAHLDFIALLHFIAQQRSCNDSVTYDRCNGTPGCVESIGWIQVYGRIHLNIHKKAVFKRPHGHVKRSKLHRISPHFHPIESISILHIHKGSRNDENLAAFYCLPVFFNQSRYFQGTWENMGRLHCFHQQLSCIYNTGKLNYTFIFRQSLTGHDGLNHASQVTRATSVCGPPTLVGGPPPCPWGRERPVAHRQLNPFPRRSRGGVVIERRMDPPWLHDPLIGGNGVVSEGRANLEFWFRSAPAISGFSYLSGPGTRLPEGSGLSRFQDPLAHAFTSPFSASCTPGEIFSCPYPPFPLRPFASRVFWYSSSVVLLKYMSVPRSGYFGPYNWQILNPSSNTH